MTTLAGFGANSRSECRYVTPEGWGEVARAVERAGTALRGLGRSYGDAAMNGGGLVLGLARFDRYLAFDEATGVLTCEAGVSLGQIIADFAPRGWFPAITPGTKYVTIGGCIGNDVHGKAHHVQGSFVTSVVSMQVLLASGQVVTASRDENVELFFGSFGGLGLLGVVLCATLQLRRVETTWFRQKAIVARDLAEMLAAMAATDSKYAYSVAWVDPQATGARLGRGVLTVGDHASKVDLGGREALEVSGPPKLNVPFDLPDFVANAFTAWLANTAIKVLLSRAAPIAHYEKFFYPLDMATNWNRGYGRRGFTQYQFVVPMTDGERVLHGLLGAIATSGQPPFLNVLKRMGKASQSPLSFPFEGYTFAIDFPIRDGTAALLERLDAMVIEAGGRIYLGKDAFVKPAALRAMYPRLPEFLALKAKLDPTNVFTSELARRVGLVP
jgi:decaprenylphospho-beta-D-ribofuranose 2-oxidase